MKQGYTISHTVNHNIDTIIEVANYKDENHVLNFGWIKENSIRSLMDRNTIGIWKIKLK